MPRTPSGGREGSPIGENEYTKNITAILAALSASADRAIKSAKNAAELCDAIDSALLVAMNNLRRERDRAAVTARARYLHNAETTDLPPN